MVYCLNINVIIFLYLIHFHFLQHPALIPVIQKMDKPLEEFLVMTQLSSLNVWEIVCYKVPLKQNATMGSGIKHYQHVEVT